ncbi:transcriptional regulator TACO1-like protein [Desarmillaria tabescens]|uniref:Transcriptional regulator TACO1-like protein n=1 Tax=Armillaria tabescens TaxID=1929756 RepID=A0AA39N657_ARMTA|nr:transcriptional regulator TACO1-like protein [Desarmillaria tabescens]KAK0459511.1 transcriptional regulator TACO1-like protein [Desarmillaria tabescens]
MLRLPRILPCRLFSTSTASLAGHNKWSKIKQKKGANDASKSATISRAQRELIYKDILVAVRTGGSADPEKNLTLAVTLRRLKELDVPKDNIERTLARASRGKDKGGEAITYEALAFGSVGVIIECLSDNTTRTVQVIREILHANRVGPVPSPGLILCSFSSASSRIAPVGFMFQRRGIVRVAIDRGPASQDAVEKLVELALDEGALDFEESAGEDDSTIELMFTCDPVALSRLTGAVTSSGKCRELLASELVYSPLERIDPSDEIASGLEQLITALEGNEDTLRVWTTVDS